MRSLLKASVGASSDPILTTNVTARPGARGAPGKLNIYTDTNLSVSILALGRGPSSPPPGRRVGANENSFRPGFSC